MQIQQHSLGQYDQLLNYVSANPHINRDVTLAPQGTQAISHAVTVAELRAAGYQPAVVLHPIFADTMQSARVPSAINSECSERSRKRNYL